MNDADRATEPDRDDRNHSKRPGDTEWPGKPRNRLVPSDRAALAARARADPLWLSLVAAVRLEGAVGRLRPKIRRRALVLGPSGNPVSNRGRLQELPGERHDPALDLLWMDDADHRDLHLFNADPWARHPTRLAGGDRYGGKHHDRH